jgi:hypothetical protein
MDKDSDVLDPDDLLDDIAGDTAEPKPGSGSAFVCDHVDSDGVCGESFDTNLKLGSHRWHRHGIKGASAEAKRQQGKRDGTARPRKYTKKPAAEKTATVAAGPSTNRAGTYTASLSMAALAAYFALPPFNAVDLDICNAGSPNIGRALANLADHNPSVARTCDLILGGGGGGDWIAVIMAVVPVVGAIAANHGVVPPTSGQRFGEMIGVAPVVPTPSAGTAPPPGSSEQNSDRTADDVIAFFAGTPETVMTDAMTKMMSMAGPIPVAVPFSTTPTENPDGHVGSEQLRPVEPAPNGQVSEQEPESAVS